MDLHSISRAVCWALSDCRAQDSLGLPALRHPGGREERREGRGGGERGGGDREGGRTGKGQSGWTPGPPENGDAAAALDAQPSLQQQLRCHLPLPSPSTGGHCASSRHLGLLLRGLSGLAPSASGVRAALRLQSSTLRPRSARPEPKRSKGEHPRDWPVTRGQSTVTRSCWAERSGQATSAATFGTDPGSSRPAGCVRVVKARPA